MRKAPPVRRTKLVVGEQLEMRALLTVAPEMLENVGYVDQIESSSDPAEFVQLGNWTLFSARDTVDGRQLWRSDGTEAGTQIIAKVGGGVFSSTLPTQLTRLGDYVYFVAQDEAGSELWQSDGTTAGTKRITNLNPTPFVGSNPEELTAWGNKLAFTAETASSGRELYVYDPAISKATRVGNVQPGPLGSVPSGLTVLGERLLFVADDGVHGRELWSAAADGSVGLVQDLKPGAAHAFPASLGDAPFALVGEWAYFSADDGLHGAELWRTNGTAAGTSLVRDIFEGAESSSPRSLTPIQGGLAFRANDGLHGTELWFSSGDAGSTRLVADLAPGPETSSARDLVAVGDRLFFVADDGQHGLELWTSDLKASTQQVADLRPGADGSRPEQLVAWNDRLMFLATTPELGRELWQSDGTAAGTKSVADLNPGTADGAASLTATGGKLWLSASDGKVRQEPWVLAPGQESPQLAKNISFTLQRSGQLNGEFVSFGDHVYFSASNKQRGAELWRSAGTDASTELVVELVPGKEGSSPHILTVYAGRLYFSALGQLWSTDGTAAGTKSIPLGDVGGETSLAALAVANDQLFMAFYSEAGTQLWRLDLRTDPTAVPKLVQNGSEALGNVEQLTVADGRLYFVARSQAAGLELWSTDGDATALVADLAPGLDWSDLRLLSSVGSALFFLERTPAGASLWRTDAAGKNPVRLIDAGDAAQPRIEFYSVRFLTVGDELYFSALGAEGDELWRTVGLGAPTLIADIYPGSIGSRPYELTLFKGEVYFIAVGSTGGPAVWRTDGSALGTRPVFDVDPSANSHEKPSELEAAGDWLYFTDDDRLQGVELWRTSGIASDTARVADLWPGAESSLPQRLSFRNGALYFTAKSPDWGRMPFVLGYAVPIAGDANFDGQVNLSDFGVLKSNFGGSGGFAAGDFNGDGQIDLSDFGLLKQHFGSSWNAGPAASTAPTVPTAATSASVAVEFATQSTFPSERRWLDQAAAWSLAADAAFAHLGDESTSE